MESYSLLSEFDLLINFDLDLDLSKMNLFQILTYQLIPESFITPQLKLSSGSCSQTNRGENNTSSTSLSEVTIIIMTSLSALTRPEVGVMGVGAGVGVSWRFIGLMAK